VLDIAMAEIGLQRAGISLALENGKRNGVGEKLVHLPIGTTMLPLPAGKKVDVILSNPAQLPLPQQDRENSPFYAGPDGRSMIDALIREAPTKLTPSGHLLMTHNSLANLRKRRAVARTAPLGGRPEGLSLTAASNRGPAASSIGSTSAALAMPYRDGIGDGAAGQGGTDQCHGATRYR
jgi:hypothetical protein